MVGGGLRLRFEGSQCACSSRPAQRRGPICEDTMQTPPLTRWVRPRFVPLVLGLILAPLGAVLVGQGAPSPEVRGLAATTVAASGEAVEKSWAGRVESMTRAGDLRLLSSVPDMMIEGRVRDRFDQYVGDARVFGAQLVRQRSAAGVRSCSVKVYPVELGITPTTAPWSRPRRPDWPRSPDVRRCIAAPGSWCSRVTMARSDSRGICGCSPRQRRVHALRRRGHRRRGPRIRDMQRQSAVGSGPGVLGDERRSAPSGATGISGRRRLRPPSIVTYDMSGDVAARRSSPLRVHRLGAARRRERHRQRLDRRAGVDAHVYFGCTYDYFFKRFGRRGLDGTPPIRAIVHPASRVTRLSTTSR